MPPVSLSELGISGAPSAAPGAASGASPAVPIGGESEPSWLDVTGGAAIVGLTKDPLIGGALRLAARANPDLDPDQLAGLEYRIRNSPTAAVMETIGEYAPMIATGIGAFAAGRVAARAAAGAVIPSVGRYLAQEAGAAAVMKPLAARVAEVVGGSVASGLEQSGRAAVEGQDAEGIVKAGALGAALTGGTEAALGIGSRLLFGKQVPLEGLLGRMDPVAETERTQLTTAIQQIDSHVAAGTATPNMLVDRKDLVRKLSKVPATRVMDRPLETLQTFEARLQDESAALGTKIQKWTTEQQTLELKLAGLAGGSGTKGVERQIGSVKRRLVEANMQLDAKQTALQATGRFRSFVEDPELAGAQRFYLGEPQGPAPIRVAGVDLPGNLSDLIRKTKVRLLESPETAARREGVVATRVVDALGEADHQRRLMQIAFGVKVDDLFQKLAQQTGNVFSNRLSGKWADGILELWETPGKGLPAIEAKYGAEAAQTWAEIAHLKDQGYSLVERMGVEPMMTPERLAAMGVENHYPQFFRKTPEGAEKAAVEAIQKQYAKRGTQISYEEARDKLMQISRDARGGLRRVGSLDFQRLVPGTTAEKVALGLDIERDPRAALLQYFNGVAHRAAYGSVFGPNMELKPILTEAAIAEGANPAAVRTLFDSLLGVNYADEAGYQTARVLNNIQVLTKLGLAVFPNLSQSVNNVLLGGMKVSARAMYDTLRGESNGTVRKALGMTHGILDSVQDVILGLDRKTPLDGIVQGFLGATQFSRVEAFNRIFAGSTGLAIIRDDVGRTVAGNLRGEALMQARRRMAQLGINLDTIANAAKRAGSWGQRLGTDEIDQLIGDRVLQSGVYNGARLMQFLPDQTRLPVWWRHPLGRVATQFKSFAFNQSKFIRDNVFREVQAGNVKPLAYFLTLYPAAGAAVNEALGVFGKKNKDSAMGRYVDGMLAVGGVGLAYNAAMSLKFGDGPGFLFGPTFSDMMDYASALFGGRNADNAARKIQALPSYRLGRALIGGSVGAAGLGKQKLMELMDEADGDESTGNGSALKPAELMQLLRGKP